MTLSSEEEAGDLYLMGDLPISENEFVLADFGKEYSDWVGQTGIGWFHVALLVFCGMANASDAVEILALSFALPDVIDQFNISGKFRALSHE